MAVLFNYNKYNIVMALYELASSRIRQIIKQSCNVIPKLSDTLYIDLVFGTFPLELKSMS